MTETDRQAGHLRTKTDSKTDRERLADIQRDRDSQAGRSPQDEDRQ